MAKIVGLQRPGSIELLVGGAEPLLVAGGRGMDRDPDTKFCMAVTLKLRIDTSNGPVFIAI